MNIHHKIWSGVERGSFDECEIPVPRRRSRNTFDTAKDTRSNLDHCEKEHLLNKFLYSSTEISEHSSHVKFYRGKSNSLPAIFSSHSFKIAMNADSMPLELKTIEDRCAEFSKCLNERTFADSMQEIDASVEFKKRRNSEADDSRQICRWLHKLGMWGKMFAAVILMFVIFLLVRILLIIYA
ncbi:unnamed protein product [Mytilus coruscus]|uniref:Uncharacterized protein n=1 Tax=Mytilus coruscus TaxID=42192 RepID=A0A6J8ED32_MYTCO|nr:unnamed protein product [Mytilus coruscus]